jgi:asparagine synthase (glutamine-hydrolysing)
LEDALKAIRVGLETAVEKRLLSDRPMAALLSGGLDSSLIAALVQKKLKAMGKESLHTFSIGFEGSMDLKMARHVANYIGSEHHEVVLEPEQFWEVVPEVIGDLESYDITTIRASVGNWILGREISKNTPFKVIFNGDGSDEIFGGYKYFQRAPTDESFETESARLLQDIHQYDVLRSDRSMSSHGLEGRTPFLDKQFVAIARSVCTKWRRPTEDHMEKWILRKAFESTDLLPANILWRRKEAFSDGVSNPHESWYQLCQEYGKEAVSRDWKEKAQLQDHLPSPTAEAYYYRQVFQKKYGRKFERLVTPYYWMPRWSPEAKDPSARTLS